MKRLIAVTLLALSLAATANAGIITFTAKKVVPKAAHATVKVVKVAKKVIW